MYSTKATRCNNLYLCCVFKDGKPAVQATVKNRQEIGPAFRDLLRTLDTLGGDAFTDSARQRINKEGNMRLAVKHEWIN